MSLTLDEPAVTAGELDGHKVVAAATELLFEEARRRRRRRHLVIAGIVVGVFAVGSLLLAGGSGHLFGNPPTASHKGPPTGATIRESPPVGRSQPTPTTPKPSVCGKGLLPYGIKTVRPPGTKASVSLLPCDYLSRGRQGL
jgi:hypothetical protein